MPACTSAGALREVWGTRIPRVAAGCILAASIAAAPLEAQEPRVLSLEEALELARQNNPVLRQAINGRGNGRRRACGWRGGPFSPPGPD